MPPRGLVYAAWMWPDGRSDKSRIWLPDFRPEGAPPTKKVDHDPDQ
jgi:hypothetical protein